MLSLYTLGVRFSLIGPPYLKGNYTRIHIYIT